MARQIVRLYAKRTEDVHRFATLSEAAGRTLAPHDLLSKSSAGVESIMVIPGNMAVIIFGVILALILKAPILGFLQGADRNWLLVSNLILVVGLFAVPLIFLPRGKKFDVVLKDALAKGQMTPELRTHLDDPVVRLAHWYELISMPVIVFLMVLKPF